MSLELKLFDNQLINVPELQDNIKQKWDKEEVAKQIKEMINSNNDIKTIITFDENEWCLCNGTFTYMEIKK